MNEALRQLDASLIDVPQLSLDYLHRGHAVHFRCQHPEAAGMRVDVMARMRGVDDFFHLWERRTTLQGADGSVYELMSLPDLVQAKKTQRDKDWPMIRRLIEADRAACKTAPTADQVRLWLREARTPELLIELVKSYPDEAISIISQRPLLRLAASGGELALEDALFSEERGERLADKAYWEPLKLELGQLRRNVR